MRTVIKGAETDAGLDMAPMIDIVFLLLIFFLVATTLKRVDRELQVELPSSSASLEVKAADDLLVIGMDADRGLYVGGDRVTPERLRDLLKERRDTHPTGRIRIDADRDSRYEDVLGVVDECALMGLNNVGFHTRRRQKSR